jgi:hypothetical protein
MCREITVIPVNRVSDMRRICNWKNGGSRRRRGTRIADSKNKSIKHYSLNYLNI